MMERREKRRESSRRENRKENRRDNKRENRREDRREIRRENKRETRREEQEGEQEGQQGNRREKRSLGVGVGVPPTVVRGKHWRQMDARRGQNTSRGGGARPSPALRGSPGPAQPVAALGSERAPAAPSPHPIPVCSTFFPAPAARPRPAGVTALSVRRCALALLRIRSSSHCIIYCSGSPVTPSGGDSIGGPNVHLRRLVSTQFQFVVHS